MRKEIAIIMAYAVCIALCSGCAKKNTGDTGNNVNRNVASGSTGISSSSISLNTEDNETDSSYNPCANDKFLYCSHKENLFQSSRWNEQGVDRLIGFMTLMNGLQY